MVQTATNLVDEVWTSRPPPEANPVVVHPIKFSGCSVEDKLKQLREELLQEKARAIVLTALDEVSSCSLAILGIKYLYIFVLCTVRIKCFQFFYNFVGSVAV